MNNDTSRYAENIILIDAPFLEFITSDFKKNFEHILNRELETIDISNLLTYISLDGGFTAGKHQINALFIYDANSPILSVCAPSSLSDELNNMAFHSPVGEIIMQSYSNEDIAVIEDMFLDSLKLAVDSDNVKRMLVVGFYERYGDKIKEVLKDANGKNITVFNVYPVSEKTPYRTECIAYPIMKALGITSDELETK